MYLYTGMCRGLPTRARLSIDGVVLVFPPPLACVLPPKSRSRSQVNKAHKQGRSWHMQRTAEACATAWAAPALQASEGACALVSNRRVCRNKGHYGHHSVDDTLETGPSSIAHPRTRPSCSRPCSADSPQSARTSTRDRYRLSRQYLDTRKQSTPLMPCLGRPNLWF